MSSSFDTFFTDDEYDSTRDKLCHTGLPKRHELSKYVCGLDVGQKKLFSTSFSHRQWRKICQHAGLADLKFHDLRKTFCSLLAQNGVSTAVTQRLLEHSSPHLTNKIYTNVDPVLRDAVEQLTVGNWLS